jgi:hypothetical protein
MVVGLLMVFAAVGLQNHDPDSRVSFRRARIRPLG